MDLIPVLSWLVLGGRCRYCKKPISVQYPLVELSTAALFGLSYLSWPYGLESTVEVAYFSLWLVALIILISLAVYDLKWMELPDKFNWPFVLTGLISIAIISQSDARSAFEHLLGMVVLWGFFALLYFGSKGRWLGGGDLKFALGMGGWLGLLSGIVGLALAFYGASLVVLPLLLLGVIKRRQPVPFGPFLIAGTVGAMLYGQNIIEWYQSVFLYAN